MQLTAGRRYNNFSHDSFPSSACGARSRPPQLISVSLGPCNAHEETYPSPVRTCAAGSRYRYRIQRRRVSADPFRLPLVIRRRASGTPPVLLRFHRRVGRR